MNSRSNCAGAMRWSPLALAVALACVPGASWAQDDATELERVEVTGSRIKRAESEGQAPVLTLEREDIQATGLLSVGDIIQQITASGSALNTKFNSSGNFGFPPDGGGVGAGSTTIDQSICDQLSPRRGPRTVDELCATISGNWSPC